MDPTSTSKIKLGHRRAKESKAGHYGLEMSNTGWTKDILLHSLMKLLQLLMSSWSEISSRAHLLDTDSSSSQIHRLQKMFFTRWMESQSLVHQTNALSWIGHHMEVVLLELIINSLHNNSSHSNAAKQMLMLKLLLMHLLRRRMPRDFKFMSEILIQVSPI